MKRLLFATSLVWLLPLVVSAQVTPAGVSGGALVKPTIVAPTAFTTEERHVFEASLTGTENVVDMQNVQPTVALAWSPLAGTTYKVLRYSMLSSPPALLIPRETGPRYVAELLPGHDFYFRVVAYGSGGSPIDTTAAYHVAVPAMPRPAGGMPVHNPMIILTANCTANVPSNLALTWPKVGAVDDYTVVVRPGPGVQGPQIVNSTVTALSFNQNGLPAGFWQIELTGNYVMHDYPTPGQTTRAGAQSAMKRVTMPVTAATSCDSF